MAHQEQLFSAALMVNKPWFIEKIEFDKEKARLDISIKFIKGSVFHYEFEEEGITGEYKAYDTVQKTWRHLNFFQYECYLHANVPRIDTGAGQTRVVATPWEGKTHGSFSWKPFLSSSLNVCPCIKWPNSRM